MKNNSDQEGFRELQQKLYTALDENPMNSEMILFLSMELDQVILSFYL